MPLLTVVGSGVPVNGGVPNPLGASVGAVCATTATATISDAAAHKNNVDLCLMPVQTRWVQGVFP